MLVRFSHSWDVTPQEAKGLQENLRPRISRKNGPELKGITSIAGADISYSKRLNRVYAAVVVFSFPELTLLESRCASRNASFPYVPGFLVFREGPALLDAFEKLNLEPQLLIFDGHGLAHPRGFGLAAHMGLILDKPAMGCAKKLLVGDYQEPASHRGSTAPLVYQNREVGAIVRTKDNTAPVFVSIGHKIDLATAVEFTLSCCRGYKLPEPSRQAHIQANRLRQKENGAVR